MLYYRPELFPGTTSFMAPFGYIISGRKTPEMIEIENDYYARKNSEPAPPGMEGGWSIWSKIQVLVVLGFLICFAGGLDVSTTCIAAGVVLMVVSSKKRRDYD